MNIRHLKKTSCFVFITVVLSAAMSLFVFATDSQREINKVSSFLFPILVGAGIVLLVWSIGKLFLAYTARANETKVKEIMSVILAALLIASPSFIKSVLKTSGYDGNDSLESFKLPNYTVNYSVSGSETINIVGPVVPGYPFGLGNPINYTQNKAIYSSQDYETRAKTAEIYSTSVLETDGTYTVSYRIARDIALAGGGSSAAAIYTHGTCIYIPCKCREATVSSVRRIERNNKYKDMTFTCAFTSDEVTMPDVFSVPVNGDTRRNISSGAKISGGCILLTIDAEYVSPRDIIVTLTLR